jgi:hypothetical protein
VPDEREWPTTDVIETARLILEPQREDHAVEMAPLLHDDLHVYIGGHPATLDELRARYRRQSVGRSPHGARGG